MNEFAENKGMEFFKDARQMGVAIKYSLEVYKTRLSVFRIITGRGNQKSLYVKIKKMVKVIKGFKVFL